MENVVLHAPELPGVVPMHSGKVRDIYDLGEQLLIVTTDRVSAFDCILPNGIPGKGKVLTALSKFWFQQTEDIVDNHVILADPHYFPDCFNPYREMLEGRSMLVVKTDVVPIECVVRGYLAGSGWKSYQECGKVCGIKLPAGLRESERLPEPLFTPSTKAESGHDENISMAEVGRIVGVDVADRLREISLELYGFASRYLASRRVIIADTKFEFGWLPTGELIVIDEMMTPDSSRYWDMDRYEPGHPQEAIDKQYVRDYLETLDWDKNPPAPELPLEVVARTAEIYQEALYRVTS